MCFLPCSRGEVEPRALCAEGDRRSAPRQPAAMRVSRAGSARRGSRAMAVPPSDPVAHGPCLLGGTAPGGGPTPGSSQPAPAGPRALGGPRGGSRGPRSAGRASGPLPGEPTAGSVRDGAAAAAGAHPSRAPGCPRGAPPRGAGGDPARWHACQALCQARQHAHDQLHCHLLAMEDRAVMLREIALARGPWNCRQGPPLG